MTRTIESNSTQTRHDGDLQLVRQVLTGNTESIGVFVERMQCVPAILATQNGRMGHPLSVHDLSDVVQESLTKVWKKLDDYAGRAALETWTYRFCFLELMNGIRKKRRWADAAKPESELEELASPHVPRAVEFEFLHRGLEAVGPPEADVVRLKHFEELTFSEIAERLGVSANTAKTQYYRGLAKLKDRIDSRAGGVVQ